MADDKNCLFCKIARKEIPAKILHEDDRCVAFHDINPQAPVHFLVIPKRHIPGLNEITPGDSDEIGHVFQTIRELAKKTGISGNGYRVINNVGSYGGQTVFHIHFHVLGGRALAWPPG